jgi:hypothetical protein
MAGFFGLFGKKTKYVDDPTPVGPDPKIDQEAFFLDSDSAKTLGDIEFMRKPNVIRRSFPNTLKGKGSEVFSSISSLEINTVSEEDEIIQSLSTEGDSNGNGKGAIANSLDSLNERKRSDSSLDAFRKMAKEIKK